MEGCFLIFLKNQKTALHAPYHFAAEGGKIFFPPPLNFSPHGSLKN
jgi:hypothetical protein